MALIDQDIDFSNVQASTGTGVLPANEYILAVVESDIKSAAKNPAHRYVDITFQVLEGPYKGRRLFVKYNIKNSNETTQNIGRSELKALREAIGMLHNDETQAWHNIRFRARVTIKAGKDQFGNERPENKINQYVSFNQAAQSGPVPNIGASATPWGAPVPQTPTTNTVPQAPIYQNPATYPQTPTVAPSPMYVSNNPAYVGAGQVTAASPYVAPDGYDKSYLSSGPITEDTPIGQ